MGFDEGATFTLPSEMADYKDIVWDEMGSWIGSGKDTYKKIDGSETFTAVKLMYFHGIGVYVNGSSSGGSTNGGTASGSTGVPRQAVPQERHPLLMFRLQCQQKRFHLR